MLFFYQESSAYLGAGEQHAFQGGMLIWLGMALHTILNSSNSCPANHLPLGADTVSVTGADAEGGGTEFTVAASGGNTLSCFLHLNFFR